MLNVQVPSQSVDYLEAPLSLLEIARSADPLEGTLSGVVRLPFDELVRRARAEQFGEVDACSEALGGYLPGVGIVRIVAVIKARICWSKLRSTFATSSGPSSTTWQTISSTHGVGRTRRPCVRHCGFGRPGTRGHNPIRSDDLGSRLHRGGGSLYMATRSLAPRAPVRHDGR